MSAPRAYYNEFDPYAAEWLRNLMAAGHIPAGEVDERSIVDVRPDDLDGFTQCHFFAGIGVWSYALRQAGWPDDRPIWTGSCPCQPFSAAGKGAGFADERHLWPAFYHLIRECRPPVVFGEQVASKDGLAWFDLVQTDMEGTGYACGAVDTCAAGFGAPHIRQRLYWVAYAHDTRLEGWREPRRERAAEWSAGQSVLAGGLADADRQRRAQHAQLRQDESGRNEGNHSEATWSGEADRLADAGSEHLRRGHGEGTGASSTLEGKARQRERRGIDDRSGSAVHGGQSGPTNGFWRDADWLGCRDGKWRPVEPGTFPLAHGAAARVGRLRGYGNAIVAPQAQAFISAYMECAS